MSGTENAARSVETEVLDSFKNFAATEKLRVQERQRDMLRRDKNVKLAELKKFADSFKLNTLIPSDLIPILAKDKKKQDEITEKAKRAFEAKSEPPPKPSVTIEDSKGSERASGTRVVDASHAGPVQPLERHANQGRPVQTNFNTASLRNQGKNPSSVPSQPGPPMLGQRLAFSQQQHKAGMAPANVPPPMPIQDGRMPPTGPAASTNYYASGRRPSIGLSAAAGRMNVKAAEFKPNPSAYSFKPGRQSSLSSSPGLSTVARRQQSFPPKSPAHSSFFGEKGPPTSEKASLLDAFNPIKRMEDEAKAQGKDYIVNGGIPQPYRTLPTWDVTAENQEKTYLDMFAKVPAPPSTTITPTRTSSETPMPHQHQLPLHLQSAGAGLSLAQPQQRQQMGMPHGVMGQQHFDESRSHPSQPPSIYSSPRPQHNVMAYPSPMRPPMMYAQGQPQLIMAPGTHGMQFRPFPGGPHFQQGAHYAPMMVQQPSNGPHGAVPPLMMHSPSAGHVYLQQNQGPPPPGSGFPSPNLRAAPMSHQSSQQGHPVYVQSGQPGPLMFAQHHPGQGMLSNFMSNRSHDADQVLQ